MLQVWKAGVEQPCQSDTGVHDTVRPECFGAAQLAGGKQCSEAVGPHNLRLCQEQPVAGGKLSPRHEVQQRHCDRGKRPDTTNDPHGKFRTSPLQCLPVRTDGCFLRK